MTTQPTTQTVYVVESDMYGGPRNGFSDRPQRTGEYSDEATARSVLAEGGRVDRHRLIRVDITETVIEERASIVT